MTLDIIARVRTDFPTKFGVPRQSGLTNAVGKIEFVGQYKNPDAIRGIEGFSHLWVLWGFSENRRNGFAATVRPPRLGGNARRGVFATRSPYRPNPIGLSCVKLLRVTEDGSLEIAGADMIDGTPVYDIKPYLPFADCHADATGGFAEDALGNALEVDFPEALLSRIPPEKRAALLGALAQDPRPSYQEDASRQYGMPYAGWDIHFTVEDGILHVTSLTPYRDPKENAP
ncbi:MAG: tRNA (N6-threonylcarbamoyladenosine(37)-N6)-methyltransferase TrmO [Christensenellales bacterium]|jgi:tRNA-Thr(GGU) m(6)t(6)A37 methyltransferase TsaA